MITVELNNGTSVDVIERCAHCSFMTCLRSNNYKLLCSKHGKKKLNDVCPDFIVSEILIESLKTSRKHSIKDALEKLT